ncbi:recombinase family protein [Wolbachia endosymbiont of Folsomia candida]|uniref:recombinase family protein n=1 Tax=Wolbachia endosymbiont of Folsomia candida TaxID=169402 RepID=UPI000B2E0027|nr:recombinase family protein [Wolbachia endosymbiont of Folsomia candida]APR97875.1 recombinase family protein [Wolbachia endosymbiont of Folsomia candida]
MSKEVRCAIYTRKSDESGLEQAFNSIDSQRSVCEEYFAANKQEGWELLSKRYDDGGYSGGNLDRPGLRELLQDIEIGRVNYVIVFKLNRLTRSLVDFIRVISDRFNRNRVRFRSVTEPYLNEESTDNEFMLYLNLGIAQRERKAVGDHIRIKIAGSKQRGIWMGGVVPLGYDAKEKKLIINEEEATVVKHIFERFIELKSMAAVAKELNSQGYRVKERKVKSGKTYGGGEFKKATVRGIITNSTYIGKVKYKEKCYPGQHQAIIDEELWNKAQKIIRTRQAKYVLKYEEMLLKGVIRCHSCNVSMAATHTRKRNKSYRYYVCRNHVRGIHCPSSNRTIAAGEVEKYVIEEIRYLLANSEQALTDINETKRLKELGEMWSNLFPVKQQEIIKQLVKTVWIRDDGIELSVKVKDLQELSYAYAA